MHKTLLLVFALVILNFIPSGNAVLNTCPPGYTGANCDNPICDTPGRIDHHDGMEGDGDYIFWDYSFTCNEEYQFNVDEYITNLTVSGYSYGQHFSAGIYKGNQFINPSAFSTAGTGWHMAYYYDIAQIYGYGAYRLVTRSDESFGCELGVSSQTRLVVNGGFIVNRTDSYVQEVVPQAHQGVGRNPIQNVSSYFAFQISESLRRPGQAVSVTSYLAQGYEQTAKVKDRYNCAAYSYAGPFHCDYTADAYYHLKISGYDSRGNQWDRVYSFICEVDTPSFSPSPWTPPTECYNGGILMSPDTEYAQCYCGLYYEGQNCETIRCFHDGIIGYMQRCVCNVGYSGTYCQDVVCYDKSNIDPLRYRSVVFVIRTGRSMVGHIEQIVIAARNLAQYYANVDSDYIEQWILVTVTQGTIDMQEYDSSESFIIAIQNIPNTLDTICNDVLYKGISAYLSSTYAEVYKRSTIFVFSDGLPDDNEDTRFGLYHQLSFFRGQIFFQLADSVTGRCNIDTSSEEYRGLRTVAQFTHGHVAHLKLENLAYATYSLGASMHKAVHVMTNDFLDSCLRAPKYQSFFIDESIENFWISATGTGLKVAITTPDRTYLEPDPFYANDGLYLWFVSPAVHGGYLLTLTGTGADSCSVRVYGNTDTALWVGASTGTNEDYQFSLPTTMADAHIVAYINGVDIPDSFQTHAEAVLWSNVEGQRVVTYASNGIYRDNCAYNLYFGAYRCFRPFSFFYINIYMTSKSGSIIQRSSTAYCSTTMPTIEPPSGCLNGGFPIGQNGTCICPAHYTGNKCQTIQCLNMGTATGNVCTCINGFSGTFCETTSCYYRNSDVSFSPNGRSLSFIIQDSISTRTTIRGIRTQLATLYQDLTHQQKDWISNYQIWRFNDTTFTRIVTTSDPNDFLKGMSELQNRNEGHSDPSCRNLKVLSGLLTVLVHPGVTYDGLIYMFISGYMDFNPAEMGLIETVYELLENTRVKFNVVLMSGSPCGQDLSSPPLTALMNLAAFSGGEFIMIMPSKAGNVIRSIPTLYRGSYLYENYVGNCTTVQNFYFPVDSQTQSFTANILGDLDQDSVQYYQPDGNRKYPYNIWQDFGMGSRMDQIIKECDDGWELRDNRCWLFVIEAQSWSVARDHCHANNAVLITLFNQVEQAYADYNTNGLDYWIGLNDLTNLDVYEWDTISNSRLLLNSTGYSHWAPDQPGHSGVDKRCVYEHGNDGWTVTECSRKLPYICIKHGYDADYEPDETQVGERLARGIWKLKLRTTDGPCYVQIYAQSGIELFTQFNTDVHADYGKSQPLQNADNNRFVSHITNQRSLATGSLGQLEYSHFYRYNMSIIQAQTYQLRDANQCAYEYLSSPFKCPVSNFLSLTTGIDRFGYLYQRIQPVACFKGPQPGECINGTYYNGRCYCDPYYTGDLCSTPICQFGTLDSVQEHCKCYTGFTGPVCDTAICNRHTTSANRTPSPGNRTFVLLLDGSKNDNMGVVANELEADLKAVLDEAATYTNWFTHFTGLVFRDSSVDPSLSDVIESSDSSDFITRMMTEYNKPYQPTGVTRSIMAAVNKVLQSKFIQFRSYVWIVTANLPEDANRVTLALDAASRHHAYVNFLIIGDTTGPGGITNYTDTRLRACFDLATDTGGQFYQVEAAAGKLATFWKGLFSNLYNVYYVTTKRLLDCSSGLEEYIQVDTKTTYLIADAFINGDVTIFDPDGTAVQVTIAANSNKNKIMVAQVGGAKPGLWRLLLSGSSEYCAVSVRGQSTLDVYIAFTWDISIDGGLHSNDGNAYPVGQELPNAIVAYSSFGKLTFAQIFSPNERTLLWSSPLTPRRQCVYQYISKNVFICPESALAVSVDGEDDSGYPFRRMIHVHCIGNIVIPTFIPLNITTSTIAAPDYPTLLPEACNKSGKFDIMLVFDGSEGIAVNDFEEMVGMMTDMPKDLIIDQDHTRFIIAEYTDSYTALTANFTIIKNRNDFLAYVILMRQYGYEGNMGNNIQSIFDAMGEWRTDAKHVLVFISSMGWDKTNTGIPFTDPTQSANAFVRDGGKIIPIGFGPNANQTQLVALGRGCTQMAPNLDYLSSVVVPWLSSAVCNPDPYCA